MSGLRYIANFDSASAMLEALGRSLRGKGFPMLGAPRVARPASVVNLLPARMRKELYMSSGWVEAIPPEQIDRVDAEEIARWVVAHYPKRKQPAVLIGSSNGALVHLCAAMRIPWLPQTFLIPVRHRGVHPDEPRYSLEAFRNVGRRLLERNPDLQLHHMHDPNQDRLMIQRMGYFRVKRIRLGSTYKNYLERVLAEGATILVADCRLKWPAIELSERYYFQHGALGGATIDEYFHGGPRVRDFLHRYRSHRREWDPPTPTCGAPEAEWGFESALEEDLRTFARRRGWRVRKISFEQPEELSPLVADLYRWWLQGQGLQAETLITDSFILMDPWQTLASASVPFWTVFNTEPSAESLERYLSKTEWNRIYAMLFSHGVDSIGVAPVTRWKAALNRARKDGALLGVDEKAYPRDFATFLRYHSSFRSHAPVIRRRIAPLSLEDLERFLQN